MGASTPKPQRPTTARASLPSLTHIKLQPARPDPHRRPLFRNMHHPWVLRNKTGG